MGNSERAETSPPKSLAWLVFAGIGVIFVVYGIYAFTLQYAQPAHWDWLSINQEAVDYIGATFRYLGMVAIGFGALAIGIAFGGFRRGQKWTWYVFWLYPIFFLVAIWVTWPGLMCLPFALVSALALWMARPTMAAKDSSAEISG